ncbi:hypothetical protein ALC57_17011 [Trachymyrmex cornetzi]|uniref:Uncharacterized protein n=1 Tax=Trachymyrmex cornetzi TaxID=471704 RepID=A0A195DD56_9HYME|nr:hypothetical protein ALC57_17011 [Trachymyrmex cornetzi]
MLFWQSIMKFGRAVNRFRKKRRCQTEILFRQPILLFDISWWSVRNGQRIKYRWRHFRRRQWINRRVWHRRAVKKARRAKKGATSVRSGQERWSAIRRRVNLSRGRSVPPSGKRSQTARVRLHFLRQARGKSLIGKSPSDYEAWKPSRRAHGMYLNLNCDIVNMERHLVIKTDEFYSNAKFNPRNIEIFKNGFLNIPEFSKKLEHKINLSEYIKTNFQTDVTGIAINILGNLTRAVLTISNSNKMIERPEIVISLASIYNTKGVAVGARNVPDRLCIKLTGMENSKYNMDVITYYGANKENNARDDIINVNSISGVNRKNDFLNEILDKIHITRVKTSTETNKNAANNGANLPHSIINKKQKFKRSAEIMDPRRNNDEITDKKNFSDISLSTHTHKRESTAVIDKNNINHFDLRNNSLISYGEFEILSNFSNIKEPQQQKIQARSSEVASLNEDIDSKMKSPDEIISMQMDSDRSQKLSTQINEDPFERRKLLLDVNVNSKLIAAPGTIHRVIFDATNNCIFPVKYLIRARSSPFRIYNSPLREIYMWLHPRQTGQIAVDIFVPAETQETVNTLTLYIVNTEIMEKTVQIFVHNELSKNIDNVKPTIEYSFNSNCAGVNPWARPHPGMSQSTPMNPTDRAFRPESTENEGENVERQGYTGCFRSAGWVELLKREGDNFGQMIASSSKKDAMLSNLVKFYCKKQSRKKDNKTHIEEIKKSSAICEKEYLTNRNLSIITDKHLESDVTNNVYPRHEEHINATTSNPSSINSQNSYVLIACEEPIISNDTNWEFVDNDDITESIQNNSTKQKYCSPKCSSAWFLKIRREIVKNCSNKVCPMPCVTNG